MEQNQHHHAYYDTEGNIIIPSPEVLEQRAREKPKEEGRGLPTIIREGIAEGKEEFEESFATLRVLTKEIHGIARKWLHALWNLLLQPVWVPGRKRIPKQHRRITLFLLDTVRFGGTFAAIFTVLFISLNYQSFLEIGKSYLQPTSEEGGTALRTTEETLREKLQRVPVLPAAGMNRRNILSYLPNVGPPENRLIIPKLGLNIPLVIPPHEALLQEDWRKLEADIQEALQSGVIHYPGTARPGQAGNFFITGHSSYYPWAKGKFKTVFARLSQLAIGDEYWVYYNGDKHRYVVNEKKEVRPTNVSVLDQPFDKRLGTLMTCVPVGTTLRRLILTANEVEPITAQPLAVGALVRETPLPKVETKMLPI